MGWLVLLAFAAQAELSPIVRAPKNPLSQRPQPFPKVTCANVLAELGKLKAMGSEHNQAVAGFMDDVIVAMEKWHQKLLPLEGKEVKIPAGEFVTLKTEQKEMGDTQTLVWDNMATLDGRFDEILQILPSCLKKKDN